MAGQPVIPRDEYQDEIIRMTYNADPGAEQVIYLGVAPRDMYFEHLDERHTAAFALAHTGTLAYVPSGVAAAGQGEVELSTSTIDFNSTANTVQQIQGDPENNFVPAGALVYVYRQAAQAGSLGVVSIDASFRTRQF